MTVEDLKAQGNKAFSAGNFPEAIKFFTEAIEIDSNNHVLYSNRSAAYASQKNYPDALKDAESCISISPQWPKGYSRKGAALMGMRKLKEAEEAYKEGLKLAPEDAGLKKGLQDVETAIHNTTGWGGKPAGGNPFANMFGPDLPSKMAANPKLAPLLGDKELMGKIAMIQQNPQMINMYLQDPKVMQLVMGLIGLDPEAMSKTSEADKDTVMEDVTPPDSPARATPPKKQPESKSKKEEEKEHESSLTDEERQKRQVRKESDTLKEEGNALYKKKEFEKALEKYQAAWEKDETNIAVLTNRAAALFEMERYQDVIAECEKAITKGREIFADYKIIARANARIAAAYHKLGDIESAIKFYQKSLTEFRDPGVLEKLRVLEKEKKIRDEESYRDPVKAEEARDKGNEVFKKGDYATAISYYSEAIKRNPTDPRNWGNRAAAYMKVMAFPEAERDCDECLKLDVNFVKAYIRKSQILLAKRDYVKSMDLLKLAKEHDTEGKHTAEIDSQTFKCYQGLSEVQSGDKEETMARAMQDPDVREVLSDPIVQGILEQAKNDPRALTEHMKNPTVAEKMKVLINAGIIRMG